MYVNSTKSAVINDNSTRMIMLDLFMEDQLAPTKAEHHFSMVNLSICYDSMHELLQATLQCFSSGKVILFASLYRFIVSILRAMCMVLLATPPLFWRPLWCGCVFKSLWKVKTYKFMTLVSYAVNLDLPARASNLILESSRTLLRNLEQISQVTSYGNIFASSH